MLNFLLFSPSRFFLLSLSVFFLFFNFLSECIFLADFSRKNFCVNIQNRIYIIELNYFEWHTSEKTNITPKKLYNFFVKLHFAGWPNYFCRNAYAKLHAIMYNGKKGSHWRLRVENQNKSIHHAFIHFWFFPPFCFIPHFIFLLCVFSIDRSNAQ